MQTVHFIRHGEGFHNIGFGGNLDAHLTPFGWTQAHALNEHIHTVCRPLEIQVQPYALLLCSKSPSVPFPGLCQLQNSLASHHLLMVVVLLVQLIVVSPMVRTLETATGAFGTGVPEDPSRVMMVALEGRAEWQSEHAAVALPHGVPVISHEGCRERVSTLPYVAILNCHPANRLLIPL